MRWRIAAFTRFCYDFVIGDDWTVAAGVVIALGITYGLRNTTAPTWSVLPAAVIILLPASLWRVARRDRPKPKPSSPNLTSTD